MSYSRDPEMVIGGTEASDVAAADTVGLYTMTNVDGVAGVVVMPDGVLTIADGREFGVAGGPGVGPGVEEGPLIELGANILTVDLLAPGPNLDTHAKVIEPKVMGLT